MNHPNRSRQRSQRIAAEAERWAPILRGRESPYEAAGKILDWFGVNPDGPGPLTRADSLAGALLAFTRSTPKAD